MSEVDSLASALAGLNPNGKILPQGVVQSVAYSNGITTCAVTWGANATATPTQYFVESYLPKAGDTVWGIRDGDVTIILGKLGGWSSNGGPETVKQLAHAIVSTNTGGACKGKWADGTGAGVTSTSAGSTDVDLSLGLASVPVLPNRLLRAKMRLCDADVVDNAYRTITLYANWNSAGFGPYRRSTTYANGDPGTALYNPIIEEFVFITPSNASTLSLKTYGNTNAGTAYFYRYASYTGQDVSHLTLEDIGSAKDYLGQGGIAG